MLQAGKKVLNHKKANVWQVLIIAFECNYNMQYNCMEYN